MSDPTTILADRFARAIAAACGAEHAGADPLIRPAANPKFGDYQANVAMSLAKAVGRKPRDVAAAIVEKLDLAGICEPPEVAGPGFVNLTLTREFVDRAANTLAGDQRLGIPAADPRQRVVVDYSSPNVAKEMHVGHLRSTVIGDAIVRTLEALGHTVVRQNHIGDWGTQFGMLIEHLADSFDEESLTGMSFDIGDLNRFYQSAKKKFDEDADFSRRSRQRVVALQGGDVETYELWRALYIKSLEHFDRTYDRLGVCLTDDDLRGESAYNNDLPGLTQQVIDADVATESQGAVVIPVEGFEAPMIVRKSDGGYGYDATDLAALRYRVDELEADRIIYVTDSRQAQHFAMLFDAGRRIGWLNGAAAEHVAFGTVLGEDGRPFKTRSGETVKLSDLLDEAEQRAADIVARKNPDLGDAERVEVARVVGIGAIKYADLSSDRTRDYVFSWDRMLAMDGNTAPYLQYAYARIRSIFRKADAQLGTGNWQLGTISIAEPAERALVMQLIQFGSIVERVGRLLEPHHLCNYLYDLATAFSGFYENCPVLRADPAVRDSRLRLCDLTANVMQGGLGLLGIEVLERM
jgi:arginyl-tRNA synthetase